MDPSDETDSQAIIKRPPWTAIFIFLFLTVSISVSSYYYYRGQKRNIFAEQSAQLKALADLKAAQIGNWLGERQGDARLIMENPFLVRELLAFLRGRPDQSRGETIRGWMASLLRNYHYWDILLLNASGKVALAPEATYPVIGTQGQYAMEAARRQKNPVISDLHRSPQVNRIHMDVVVPLLSEGDVEGFVFLRVDPADYLFPIIQSWPTPSPSAETLLVRQEGNDVLFLNELRHRKNTALKLRFAAGSLDLPAARAVSGKTGVFAGRDYRGVAVWSVSLPVPGTSWFIVAKVDRDEIERPLLRNALAVFLVGLFLILATAPAILFLWQRQNSRFRLRQLEDEIQKQALVRQFDNERQAAHSALLESQRQITLIYNTVGDVIFNLKVEADGGYRFTSVNQQFLRATGLPAEQIVGKRVQEIIPEPSLTLVLGKYAEAIRTRKPVRWEETTDYPTGRVVGEVGVTPVLDDDGRCTALVGSVHDVTERKRIEEALRLANERLRRFIDANVIGVIIADASGKVIEANDYYLNLIGFTRQEFEQGLVNWRGLTPPEWLPADERALGELAATGTCVPYEKEYLRRDGTRVMVYLADAMLPGPEKQIAAFALDLSERKRAEEEIRSAKAFLEKVIDMSPFAMWISDKEGAVTRVNQSLCDSIKLGADKIVGIYNVLKDANLENQGVMPDVKAVFEKGQPARFSIPWQAAAAGDVNFEGARDMYIDVSMFPILGPRGELANVVCQWLDISDRKRAEQALRELSARNEALLAAVPDIIMEVDNGKVYRWANPAGLEFFGDNVVGKPADAYFEGEQKTYASVQPLFNGREDVIYVESWQRRRDGEKRLLAWWCRVLKDREGKTTGALSSARDITDIHRAGQALRESEEKFRQVFEASNIGKSLTLIGGEVIPNQALCDMLGYSLEELRRKKWQELTPADEIAATEQVIEPLLSGKQDAARFNKRYIRKDGSIIYGDISVAIRRDASGRPLHFITTIVDISKRMHALEEVQRLNEELEERVRKRTAQLEAANKELEAFSYSVSHDLRAPLRAISGFSRIVMEEYAPKLDAEGRRLLDVIVANTNKMGQLIDDLLAFSRLGRQPIAYAQVDLASLAREVFAALKNPEKGRKIDFKIGALAVAWGDRSMLRLVLQNLLANAIKFTRRQGRARIELGARAADGATVYFVKDNGVGFDMEYAHKLFGVFQRLHSTDEFEGTGVGLANVQRIILRHGGRVWAESTVKGGATFYFALPATVAGAKKPKDGEGAR